MLGFYYFRTLGSWRISPPVGNIPKERSFEGGPCVEDRPCEPLGKRLGCSCKTVEHVVEGIGGEEDKHFHNYSLGSALTAVVAVGTCAPYSGL